MQRVGIVFFESFYPCEILSEEHDPKVSKTNFNPGLSKLTSLKQPPQLFGGGPCTNQDPTFVKGSLACSMDTQEESEKNPAFSFCQTISQTILRRLADLAR